MDFVRIQDENLEILLAAVLSLFCVLTAHEIVEGFVVYSKNGFSENAIRNWALLRSHGSLSETVHILRGRPLFGAEYHVHSRRDENCDTCADVQTGKVMYKRYITILFVRVFLISIEVAFIALSLTRKQYLPITEGGVMVTWKGSGLGNTIPILPKLGCSVARAYNNSAYGYGNKAALARLVYCLESNPRGAGGVAVSRDKIDFEITADIMQNKVILESRTGEFNTLQFRAYWSTSRLEGLLVPLVKWNTTARRNLCGHRHCLEEWRTSINDTLKGIYGSSYRPVLEHAIVDPSKLISLQFEIATGRAWPPLFSKFWTKQRKLEETVNIVSSIIELTVVENGSSLFYSQEGRIESLSVDRAFLNAQPIVSTGVLVLLLLALLALRFIIGCARPNRCSTGFYSVLKTHAGLGYGCAPLTRMPIRQTTSAVEE